MSWEPPEHQLAKVLLSFHVPDVLLHEAFSQPADMLILRQVAR